MSNHTTIKTIRLFAGVISLALSAMINAGQAPSIKYAAGGSQIIITDLGLLPGGTFSSGLAINNEPVIVGLANDDTFAFQRPFWDANTGVIIGFADNFNPAGTAIPEHLNGGREMAGSEVFGDNCTRASIGIPPARHSCCHRWPVSTTTLTPGPTASTTSASSWVRVGMAHRTSSPTPPCG